LKILITISVLFLFLGAESANAQARLTIQNNSMRSMTVKVMAGYGGKGSLHERVTIEAFNSETVYFSESGYFFTKTKAVIKGKDPVYRKGQPFKVTSNDYGYSVMTLTFSIRESAVPQATGGKQISKAEYDQD
jgi:hypothetical protein